MNQYLLVFFTAKNKMLPVSGPFGPFASTGLAFEFAEAHYKALRAERGAQPPDGFFTVPADNYAFDAQGKAVVKHLPS